MLKIFEHVPDGLLQAGVGQLDEVLGGPALIHLQGRREEPLFVSVLLHGNEEAGFYAVQTLLRDYRGKELPRALSVFIGNVAAARHNQRFLEGQPDYNRIWPGGETGGTQEHVMMASIVEEMSRRRVFASIDVHNNTGINPHYACVNRLENRFLNLATLFSRTVVYFTRPRGVQSMAFAALCPAVTIECGKAGQPHGVEHSREFMEAALHLSDVPEHPLALHDIDLFHTVAVVKIPPECSFSFDDVATDIRFNNDLDHLNFRELPAGTTLGRARPDSDARLEAWDENGSNVGKRYFLLDDNFIRTRRAVMPSMFTLDKRVIRQDCLGYLMERLSPESCRQEG
jgi:succinylglutamate desuccinylase